VNRRTRNRLVIVGIGLLFFGPVLLAVLMQSPWWHYEPERTVNRGELVDPPLPFALADLRSLGRSAAPTATGTWTMLYRVPSPCDARCLEDITGLRQIHIAAGRHRAELDAVLLADDAPEETALRAWLDIYPEFGVRVVDDEALRERLDRAQGRPEAGGEGGFAFVLDPDQNLILAYPPRFNPANMNKDLKRLLKWSGQERGS
jgi:hypothetical protein